MAPFDFSAVGEGNCARQQHRPVGKCPEVSGRFLAVMRLRITHSMDTDRAVATDYPVVRSRSYRRRLALRQAPGQLLATLTIPLYLAFIERRRPNFKFDPGLLQHGSANLAVAGQYQGHSAPVEKSVE